MEFMIFMVLGLKGPGQVEGREAGKPGSPDAGKPGSRDPRIPGSREAGKPGCREAESRSWLPQMNRSQILASRMN